MIWRFHIFFLRLRDFIVGYPARCLRLLKWLMWISMPLGKHRIARWFAGLVMLSIDLTPLPVIISFLLDSIKWKSRLLNDEEIVLGKSVFSDHIPWHLITLDVASLPVKWKWTLAYVQFHTINCGTSISSAVFIHELAHIWQYETHGSIYITESAWAQRWGGGYNYGGLEKLKAHLGEKGLGAFNFEQQADIIEDAFRYRQQVPLQWSSSQQEAGEVLEAYLATISKTAFT